jgi:hypothetical protein
VALDRHEPDLPGPSSADADADADADAEPETPNTGRSRANHQRGVARSGQRY